MLMEDFGTVARNDEEADYAAIFTAYGKFQRESARHQDELMAAGCITRSLEVLAGQIEPLVADPIIQTALTPEQAKELKALVPQLQERCAKLAEYNLPTSLLHGDLHPGNITRRNGDYIFFDWTDAALGFPFLDHFLLYFELDDEPGYLTWRDAYLDAWREFESPAHLLEVWELAKPLCALHHAVSYLTIANHIEPLTSEELFHGLPDNLYRLLAAMRA
jgi:Ser/Thr protein kinase RdoA (MazF antagonist)